MRILLYEYLTGGGVLQQPELADNQSLMREGAAMLSAIAADLAAISGVQVLVLRDLRFADLDVPNCEVHDVSIIGADERLLARLAPTADWTMIIAPETGGVLARQCRLVLEAGGRLLGPSPEIVELCSDKHGTAEHLRRAGVPVPHGVTIEPGAMLPIDFPYPAVAKPRDGCGSQDVRLVKKRVAVHSASRLETFCPGTPASVAILCGPHLQQPLAPCRQLLSDDGRFTYYGSSLTLAPGESQRARLLAMKAIDSLDGPLGYLGVDLVLGAADDGSQDYVIEINPRLTTSYVTLRAASSINLAEAMLLVAAGGR